MRRFLGLTTVALMSLLTFTTHAETCTDSEGNSVEVRFQHLPNGDYKIGGFAEIDDESYKILGVSSDGGGSVDVKLQSLKTGLEFSLLCGSDQQDK